METIYNHSLPKSTPRHIRQFEPARDLNAVADLVELCFASTLDGEGHRYLRQMRAAARNPRLLQVASRLGDKTSFPMSGFIWEDNGILVGNLSLIPFQRGKQRRYLIANVAVHPDYRRRGIARALTYAALEELHRLGISAPWLQVRDDNPEALNLYLSMGFKERFRRTTWQTHGGKLFPRQPETGVKVVPLNASHRQIQQNWYRQSYPPEMEWHLPFKIRDLRPDLLGSLIRMFNGIFVRQWGAVRGGRLIGAITWQATDGGFNTVWLGVENDHAEAAAQTLLPFVVYRYARHRMVSLEFPAGRLVESIIEAGFHKHQTLIWMQT
jgi:ribosomal protein S18 acetylase RimI-like enzyme